MPLSATASFLAQTKPLIPEEFPSSNHTSIRNLGIFSAPTLLLQSAKTRRWTRPSTLVSAASSASKAALSQEGERGSSESPISKWGEFASRVSGEWDGYGAEFTSEGKPIELPEAVVPEAFREWEVEVFDWQTQCPTLAETGKPTVTYKQIKLLPTVGCEADAATRYSVEEKVVGGVDNNVSAFAYDQGGSYVAIWNLKDRNDQGILELEHCLVDPRDQETRVRIFQVLHLEPTIMELQKIRVFSESWYGPFRNGEQLGGCAIRESGFASTAPLEKSKVLGVWQGARVAASFTSAKSDIIHELVAGMPQKLSRDAEGLVTLPKQLWSCLKAGKEGEICAEVGWLLDHGRAVTSKCIISKDGSIKAITMGNEAALLGDA